MSKGVNDHRLSDFRPQSGAAGRINVHISTTSNNGNESPQAASDITDKEVSSDRSGSPYNHDPDAEEYNEVFIEDSKDVPSATPQKLYKKQMVGLPQPNIAPPKKSWEDLME